MNKLRKQYNKLIHWLLGESLAPTLQTPIINELRKNREATGTLLVRELLSRMESGKPFQSIREAEFRVYSQWGEDGVIQYLINYLNIPHHTFVEFGVANYDEANTRFLLVNNNWRGCVIDGSGENIEYIKKQDIYWRHDLTAVHSFITAENINDIIKNAGFEGELGLLSVDIDGTDYYVLKAIEVVKPIILICEYNSVLGDERAITIPYKPDFVRHKVHYSNLYWGMSLGAAVHLATTKGYSYIGCCGGGANAFFVRNDYLKDIPLKTVKEGFVLCMGRESRDHNYKKTFIGGSKRLDIIKGLPVVNVITGEEESI
jgi:hypothetical protein